MLPKSLLDILLAPDDAAGESVEFCSLEALLVETLAVTLTVTLSSLILMFSRTFSTVKIDVGSPVDFLPLRVTTFLAILVGTLLVTPSLVILLLSSTFLVLIAAEGSSDDFLSHGIIVFFGASMVTFSFFNFLLSKTFSVMTVAASSPVFQTIRSSV